jgi:hypothetical protein
MTETMGSTAGGTPTNDSSTRDVAKDEAKGVAQDAVQSGKQTAETAKAQAGEVAGEAMSQARTLVTEARQQLTSQGSAQQEKAASGLHSLADELTGMVNGEGSQNGLAAELATQASERIRGVASWLESREPADLLAEVRRFARQRPGVFLLSAATAGFIGGRLTRSIAAESSDSGPSYPGGQSYAGGQYATTGVATGYPAPTTLTQDPYDTATVVDVPPVSPNASGYSTPPASPGTQGTAGTFGNEDRI